ncbi:spermatogenesis-associated protein 13-like isoform X3 [Centruroides sculpturatus]|uniref:spermatogenesis-associated protein 13-like isoform X3 n=1 Tax=Centruroides sculpturatus TaxID=218467 RepID=UPI000C6E2ED7|nr:spermatogenesis-associated protein 13-like isoform X3 [Centruroides sculpturatus]
MAPSAAPYAHLLLSLSNSMFRLADKLGEAHKRYFWGYTVLNEVSDLDNKSEESNNLTELICETEDKFENFSEIKMGVDHSRSSSTSIDENSLSTNGNDETKITEENEELCSEQNDRFKEHQSLHVHLIRNRLISRSERQLKTTSSPEFQTINELSSSAKDIHRPWSELYNEEAAEEILQNNSPSSSTLNIHKFKSDCDSSHVDLSSGEASPVITSSCNSIQTSSPKLSDGVLQKFCKTFSLRFQRAKKLEQQTCFDSLSENHESQFCSQNSSNETAVSPLVSKHLRKTYSEPNTSETGSLFRLGSVVLRSSKDKRKDRKSRKTDSKCYSADSGIQIEMVSNNEVFLENSQLGESPALIRRRAASTSESSPKTKPPPRPHSDVGSSLNGNSSVVEAFMAQMSRQRDNLPELKRHSSDSGTPLKKTPSVERQLSTPSFIKMRTDRSRPIKRRGHSRLHRSISQPLDLEKVGLSTRTIVGFSDHEGSRDISTASSEDDFSSDGEDSHISSRNQTLFREFSDDGITYAEALWDHVTIDAEELAFQAGEVIEVTDSSDKDWWWGSIGTRSGWFPAAFVRLRVNQEDTVEDCISKMNNGTLMQQVPRKMSVSLLSNEQVRANVVKEIVSTEKDFVQHLKDVVEGYLRQVRRRSDMFSDECIATIFGNIEEIYHFQSGFLKHLESCIDMERPHLSQIGNCFLKHKDEFEIYSEYCNNHPLAVSELQELYADSKYIHFFEACRLLQEMIDISLDGFLLTPVQKICKYPLQLAELLKYTKTDHPDFQPVTKALAAMREVAQLVNERKRRMECLERLTEWQQSIDGWEGPDLLDTSSMLLHSGEVTRAPSTWSRDLIHLFLFDHLIIYCKKDLLKRNTYVYKGRIDLDDSCVIDLEDGKDLQFGVTVKNAWKVYCATREKWFLFYTKTPSEKEQWLQSFKEERKRVKEDKLQGYVVTEEAKKAARLAVINKFKPKRPRAKLVKGSRPHPDTAVAELLLDPPEPKSRTGSLPSNLHPSVAVSASARHGLPKKKGSGWFHFGSSKKPKK